MPTLRPFRDYDEKDVINLYAYSGAVVDATYNILATKGTFVKITGDGFRNDVEPLEMLGNFGAFNTNNWVGQRYGAVPKVTVCNVPASDNPVGMLLFDVRELDENQLPLKYNPQKAAEMEAVLSGQAVPIVTKGVFLYSGVRLSGTSSSGLVAVTAGNPAYLGYAGEVATSGTTIIGKFLGTTGSVQTTGSQYGTDNSAIALLYLNIR